MLQKIGIFYAAFSQLQRQIAEKRSVYNQHLRVLREDRPNDIDHSGRKRAPEKIGRWNGTVFIGTFNSKR
jgi:hypothetical protein